MAIIGLCSTGVTAKGNLEGFLENPAGKLVYFLENLGHTVVDYQDTRAEVFVALDHHQVALDAVIKRIPVNQRLLVVQEPLVVLPANYSPKIQKSYGCVISLTPETGKKVIPWPQANWEEIHFDAVERDFNSIIMVNSNKNSFLPGSRYGLRRRVMQEFLDNEIVFDLAGSGWDRNTVQQAKQNATEIAYALFNGYLPRISEYSFPTKDNKYLVKHGVVPDKYELMASKDFAVVIENSQTYVSEKLFDAIISGCIPLYCGPELSQFGIPQEVAISLPNDPKAFLKAYHQMTNVQKESIRKAGKDWLQNSETIITWSQNHALERLAKEISKSIVF